MTVDRSRRRVLAGSAAVLGTLGAAGASPAAASDLVGRQSGGATLRVTAADDEVDAGETTRVEVVLSEVPESGMTGWTILVELTGSGEAGFTGNGEFTDAVAAAGIDTENTDDDASAFLIGSDMGDNLDGATSDLLLGDVEVQGVEEGDVDVSLRVDELSDGNNDRIDADVGTASFSVVGSAPDAPLGAPDGGDDSDGGGGGDDVSVDVDPAPGDGDGSSGETDGSGDSGGSEGSDGSDDGSDADGGESGGDDGGSDGTPGFGIGAAIAAVLAGSAARVVRRPDSDDADLGE